MSITLIDGNNRFRAYFEKLGASAMQTLFHRSNTMDPNNRIIWVWDGKNSLDRRKQIYPEYKGNKHHAATDEFHKTTAFFKQLLSHSTCLQIEVPGFEADDVIAAIALASKEIITIDSNDADFLALVCNRIVTTKETLEGVKPEFVRLYKTLVGDKSDNVKGVKGFAEKSWQGLEDSEKRLLIKHFNGEALMSGKDVEELCGFTSAQVKFWDEQQELLKAYWQVVGFFDVPYETIAQHLKAGVYDPAAAQELLKGQLLSLGGAMSMGAVA